MVLLSLLLATALAQRPDPGPGLRPNPARDAALMKITAVTTGEREDDHPSIASKGGTVWTAWVSYSEASHNTLVMARSWRNGKWGNAERVTESAGDYHKPAVTIVGSSVVVVWPAQVNGNWDLYSRVRAADGKWSAIERLTTDAAPDFHTSIAASGEKAMLVWQSMRRGNHDILYRLYDGGAWTPEAFVTTNAANDWEPVIASTADGAFHVAWDSARGSYDVMLRSWRNGKWSEEMAVAASPKLENHAMLTSGADGKVWIAWEIGGENWGSDSANDGLRPHREIGLACLDGGKLMRLPVPPMKKEGLQAATLIAHSNGGVRLLAREPMNKNWLTVNSTSWDGAKWAAWETLPYSEGRIDQRIAAADAGGGRVMAVFPAGSSHNIIYARLFDSPGTQVPAMSAIGEKAKDAPKPEESHKFNGYTAVFGDLHRHTDISEDGGIIDGSLLDAMRYALDSGGLNFIGITDHTRYLPRRYNLFRIQQIADLLYNPGKFSAMHAYERSQYTPWGHRNVVHQGRNYTPVPAGYDLGDPGVSPWGLFDALRGKKAMSIPHTSAWGNKQVSWDYFDPQVERLVEMYQGLRSTYEYNGAPDPADRQIYEKDSKNFVWDALSLGRKLGFIASSDHRSTHMSFAVVYVKKLDREGVFEGLHARRTYAATDKIFVDFQIGKAMMGEETTSAGEPELSVAVTGTAELARIDVVKNGAFAYTIEPRARSSKFQFRDKNFDGKESYYYVRVMQRDKQMAWSSPIWVKR